MSTSPISRLVRPAILLVAGMLLGQGALAVAAPSAPAATQIRVASCSGFGFHPIDSRTTYLWFERQLHRYTSDGDGWFMCVAQLPHRAVVSKVRFTLLDGTERGGFEYCGLVRTGLGVTGSVQAVAMPVTGTGIAAAPGTRRYSTTSIQNATVDNGAFAYTLQCRMVFQPGVGIYTNRDFGIIGADVTYRISSANG